MRITAPCAVLVLAAVPVRAAVSAKARSHKVAGDERREAGDAAAALEAYREALKVDGGYASFGGRARPSITARALSMPRIYKLTPEAQPGPASPEPPAARGPP